MSQQTTPASPSIVVYGAYGHTGRFIVAEMVRRGLRPVLAGRDAAKLAAISALHGGLEMRAASVDDPAALDRMLQGACAVIHAAGPFSLTADAMVRAAIRARVHYFDVAAEPDVVAATIEEFAAQAEAVGIFLAPALGFYGTLGQLAAAAAMADWRDADSLTLAYALSSWQPTEGTRATIDVAEERRGGRRLVFADGRLQLRDDPAPTARWDFPAPIGRQEVTAQFTTADSITLSRRFDVKAIDEYMTLAPLKDLAGSSPPLPVDARGRSAQTFLVEAIARSGAAQRTVVVRGQDIYAVTAPLVVEAVQRALAQPPRRRGLLTASDLGEARAFLESLAPEHLALDDRSASTIAPSNPEMALSR